MKIYSILLVSLLFGCTTPHFEWYGNDKKEIADLCTDWSGQVRGCVLEKNGVYQIHIWDQILDPQQCEESNNEVRSSGSGNDDF